MDIWWDAALWALVLWLGAVLFQVADLGTAWFDLRSARTGSGQLARRRAHELFWVLPLAALIGLVLAFAVALGAQAVLEQGWRLAGGLAAALLVVIAVTTISVFGLIALLTRDVQSYVVLRFRVANVELRKVSKENIAGWRSELEAIDAREAVRHESIARLLRLIPIALGVATLLCVLLAVFQAPVVSLWPLALIVSLLPALVSILLASRSARVSLRARAEWALLNGRQRAEVVQTIDELDRRTNRGVAGLSDRVNRALQILREQQS